VQTGSPASQGGEMGNLPETTESARYLTSMCGFVSFTNCYK
jgi:hypothetical protein